MATQRRDSRPAAPSGGQKSPFAKLIFIAAIVAGAAWLVFPMKKKIKLGLDLQGGTHMVLLVDLDDAIRSSGERTIDDIRRELEEATVTVGPITHDTPREIVITGIPEDAKSKVDEILAHQEATWDVSYTGDVARLSMRSSAETELRANASRQVKETIERRIMDFDVTEPLVTTSGNNGERIVLQLPGLDDTERVKRIITTASVMEFRLGKGQAASKELLGTGGVLPPDQEAIPGAPDSKRTTQWYAIQRGSIARGEDLIDAKQTQDRFGRPAIGFTLSAAAGRRFGEVTGKNIGQPLAIVLDGEVVQYATIQDQIFSSGTITGRYSMKEASDASLVLRSGGLPARVTIQHEQTVGPALGRDSIAAGTRAVVYGSVVIIVFMLLWYKGAGINAVIALPVNLLLILALMSLKGSTLTLPGIAGLVLTVGMAVDANVLVFERIREELSHGKAPRQAVDAGFARAFWTIFDSHMTALISAIFLLNFGTGPVKGFAITLMAGIFASIFTAVFVSHALFDLLFWLRPAGQGVSIAWTTFKAPNLPFMKYRIPAFAATVVLALAGIALSLGIPGLPHLQKGIDFEGGTQVVVKAAPGIGAEDLRSRLGGSEFGTVTIQQFGDPKGQQYLLRVKDAAASVSTATVNAQENPAENPPGEETVGVADRLIAKLTRGTEGRAVDINTVGSRTLADALRGAGLNEEDAKAASASVADARSTAGGLLVSLDGLDSAGLPPAALEWLKANASVGDVSVLTHESVGPEVGAELTSHAIRAVAWSMLFILLYIAFRFELRFGVGAIVATLHDVLITLGFLALMGQPIDTSVIAAILTVVGFSLNDTVVVFDRIREMMKTSKGLSFSEVIDRSINTTLSRTMLTSGLTFVSVVALLIWGGPVLRGFSLTLTIGIVVGTYSSIFVASPVVLWWEAVRARRASREIRAA